MSGASLGPQFMRAEDLISGGVWKEKTLTIKQVHPPNTIKGADKRPIEKMVIEFSESPKMLVVGAINNRILKFATGADTLSQLIGVKLTMYPVSGNWFNEENLTGIRIRLPKGAKKPKVKPGNMGTDITGQSIGVQAPIPAGAPPPDLGAPTEMTDEEKAAAIASESSDNTYLFKEAE